MLSFKAPFAGRMSLSFWALHKFSQLLYGTANERNTQLLGFAPALGCGPTASAKTGSPSAGAFAVAMTSHWLFSFSFCCHDVSLVTLKLSQVLQGQFRRLFDWNIGIRFFSFQYLIHKLPVIGIKFLTRAWKNIRWKDQKDCGVTR